MTVPLVNIYLTLGVLFLPSICSGGRHKCYNVQLSVSWGNILPVFCRPPSPLLKLTNEMIFSFKFKCVFPLAAHLCQHNSKMNVQNYKMSFLRNARAMCSLEKLYISSYILIGISLCLKLLSNQIWQASVWSIFPYFTHKRLFYIYKLYFVNHDFIVICFETFSIPF